MRPVRSIWSSNRRLCLRKVRGEQNGLVFPFELRRIELQETDIVASLNRPGGNLTGVGRKNFGRRISALQRFTAAYAIHAPLEPALRGGRRCTA